MRLRALVEVLFAPTPVAAGLDRPEPDDPLHGWLVATNPLALLILHLGVARAERPEEE